MDCKLYLQNINHIAHAEHIKITGDKIFAHFYKDVYSLWKVFNLNGEYLYKIDAPELGIINGFNGDLLICVFTSTTIFLYNILIYGYTTL